MGKDRATGVSISRVLSRILYLITRNVFPCNCRCIVVYSGIHYDAATLSPIKDAPPDFHQTVFPIVSLYRHRMPINADLCLPKMSGDKSDPILLAATKLADILRQKRAFTNTATFDLKCEVCGI